MIRSTGSCSQLKPLAATGPRSANSRASCSAFSTVRLAITSEAGLCASNGSSTPRTAPPAPSRRIRLPASCTPALIVRSRTSPAPSVLSPCSVPSASLLRVFTAPAR
ncbi:hypothetical protein D3C78_1378420 [compost metagenome]